MISTTLAVCILCGLWLSYIVGMVLDNTVFKKGVTSHESNF